VCVYVYIVVLYQNKGILLAFIIRIYRDAWSSEWQICRKYHSVLWVFCVMHLAGAGELWCAWGCLTSTKWARTIVTEHSGSSEISSWPVADHRSQGVCCRAVHVDARMGPYTICIIHFMRQMIPFYVSHSCKHNLHVTPLETNDLIWCISWM